MDQWQLGVMGIGVARQQKRAVKGNRDEKCADCPRGDAPDDNFSEAVLLTFQPDEISVGSLIEIYLRTHSSTSNHAVRRKYRSAVYRRSAFSVTLKRMPVARFAPPISTPSLPC